MAKTNLDMRNALHQVLSNGTPEGPEGYDVDAIVDELYDAAGGSWDLRLVEHDVFWEIVWRNAKRTPLTGEELLMVLIKHYASARLSSRDVLASELLTLAGQHTLGLSEDAATERVGELLEEFYASQG